MKNNIRLPQKFGICLLITCILLTSVSQYVLAETLESKIDEYIENNKDTTAGLATIVMKDNEIIFSKMTGYADIEQGIKVDKETVFEWGSCSKILIWISVMQLVEDGLIELNTDVREYLPQDFIIPNSFDEPITMINLMNHNAGFDDSFTDLFVFNPTEILPLRQALEQTDVKQEFKPGDVVAYSNYGSALAAYIVEAVSGMDFREYVKENIFAPLEMTHTSIDPQQNDNTWVKIQREKIQGYTKDNKLIDPNLYVIPMYPVGSVIGTADDFSRLLSALLSEDGHPLFADNKTIELLFEPTLYYPKTRIPQITHGLFSLPAQDNVQVYGHGGNTLAFSSSMYIDRDNKSGVLVMTNQLNEENFCLGIPELIFGRPNKIMDKGNLEDSSLWTGIYKPARMPYHGFSKIYGLFNIVTVKQQDKHDLVTNKVSYIQQSPEVYLTEDGFSAYSRDVYLTHPTFGKILCSTYGDSIQVSLWSYIFELALIISGAIAVLFSLICIIIRLFKRKFPMLIQNILNLIFAFNFGLMINKTISMTSYKALKINFIINIIYLVVTISLCIYNLFRKKPVESSKKHKLIFYTTIITSLILCINICYWELYH